MTDGLVVVDKPTGWTSHDVVARCRRIFSQRRVGHSGTLDPPATGVLLIGLGRVTRLLRFLSALPKSYEGELVLGVATSTLDDHGQETERWDMSGVTVDEVRAATRGFVGPIMQIPPMVSAVQVGGQRLHALARQGVEVPRQARPVTVERFDIGAEKAPGIFPINVSCSSGTYVRALAADVGAALGGGAHLRNLRRTSIGSFSLAEAFSLDGLESAKVSAVLTPAEAMRDYPKWVLSNEEAQRVRHGVRLDANERPSNGPVALLDEDGRLVAVYEPVGSVLKAAVVLDAG